MDNIVVVRGERNIRGINGNGKYNCYAAGNWELSVCNWGLQVKNGKGV